MTVAPVAAIPTRTKTTRAKIARLIVVLEDRRLGYDRAILATGARSARPPASFTIAFAIVGALKAKRSRAPATMAIPSVKMTKIPPPWSVPRSEMWSFPYPAQTRSATPVTENASRSRTNRDAIRPRPTIPIETPRMG